jgi:sporulation protein YlmC with PRC-barrel domain
MKTGGINSMKNIIAFLIIIIGSIALIHPICAEDKIDKQVGEADRQLQVEPSEHEDRQIPADVTKKDMNRDMMRQDSASSYQTSQGILKISVFDRQGDEIGEIQEIRLDTRHGKIQYVTISPESGKEDIAVPLQALCFDQNKVVLAIDESKLEGAPSLKDLSSDKEFQLELQNYFGIAPVWPEERDQKFGVSEKDPIKGNINLKSDDNKMQHKGNSEQMSPESRNLISELRKMLLLCNPW